MRAERIYDFRQPGASACPVRGSAALDQILAEADRALYRDKSDRHARSDGRNDRTEPGELTIP